MSDMLRKQHSKRSGWSFYQTSIVLRKYKIFVGVKLLNEANHGKSPSHDFIF